MNAYGLTGNIGCGKSTVRDFLREYDDVYIIDCDQLAQDIISRKAAKPFITQMFGPEVYDGDTLSFKRVTEIIFHHPERRVQFENILHPLLWNIVEHRVRKQHGDTLSVVESAILYEKKSEDRFAAVITATCNEAEQWRRLRENRRMSDEDIRARIEQQLPSHEKEKRAQFVIHTDCTLEELRNRVHVLYTELKQLHGARL